MICVHTESTVHAGLFYGEPLTTNCCAFQIFFFFNETLVLLTTTSETGVSLGQQRLGILHDPAKSHKVLKYIVIRPKIYQVIVEWQLPHFCLNNNFLWD